MRNYQRANSSGFVLGEVPSRSLIEAIEETTTAHLRHLNNEGQVGNAAGYVIHSAISYYDPDAFPSDRSISWGAKTDAERHKGGAIVTHIQVGDHPLADGSTRPDIKTVRLYWIATAADLGGDRVDHVRRTEMA